MSEGPSFRPAKPWGWVIGAVQTFLRFELAWRNRLHLERRDLDMLRACRRGRASSSPPTTPIRRTSKSAWNCPADRAAGSSS